jgi:hypothetical protein
MAAKQMKNTIISVGQCLDRLKKAELKPPSEDTQSSLRSAELRNSVLNIAELNHVSETVLVQSAVKNVLGKLPPVE